MFGGGYILVVEDDEDVRELTCEYLRRSFADVRSACNGVEALAHLDSGGRPAVVISDILMPGVLGTTVAEYVKEMLRDIPVAFVTGSSHLAPKGSTVFEKPAKLSELRTFVQKFVVT